MCLSGDIRVKKILKSKAIIAYKVVEYDGDMKRYSPLYFDDKPLKLGISITGEPGYHAYCSKKAAFKNERIWNTRRTIAVRLWGTVRYGKQNIWNAVSATHMEIKSFEGIEK